MIKMGNTESYTNVFKKISLAVGLSVPEARIIMLGLDAAGKTTILYRMKLGEVVTTIPTIGFNVETLKHKNINFTVWDVGGRDKIRPLFRHYFANTQGFIYVLDSNDRERIGEAKKEFHTFIKEDDLRDCAILILANKQDLSNAMSVEEIEKEFEVENLKSRKINVMPATGTTGDGLLEAFEWLSYALTNKNIDKTVDTISMHKKKAVLDPIKETFADVNNLANNKTWSYLISGYTSKLIKAVTWN